MSSTEITKDASEGARAYVIDVDAPPTNAASNTEDDARIFLDYGAIQPPYDPRTMTGLFEESSALRPNVDAYKTNIEGFGHDLEPLIDLDDENVDEKIQDAIMLTKIADNLPNAQASTDEVDALKETLAGEMRIEKLRLSHFFDNCAGDISFIELRQRTRQDLEVTGNAYWEILRDRLGRPVQINLIPSPSMRLMRVEARWVDVIETRRVSDIALRQYAVKRRVRRYVQVLFGQFTAYFKELDDPRTISSRTGKTYPDFRTFQREEPGAAAATEVLHFRLHASTTAYGIPRWGGALLAVLGSRASEEVNVSYFDNKAVPPLALLVSGGTLAKGAAERIRTYIKDNIKGRKNYHSILVLEAEPTQGTISSPNGARVRIDLERLSDAQSQDALFQNYESNNGEKIGNQFRLPKLLRGDMKDFNRATADAALDYAEQQIFAPERTKVDHLINRRLMPLLDARFFKFVSRGVQTKDQPELAQMLDSMTARSIITPNEARAVAETIFGKNYPKIEEEWATQPIAITLAQIAAAAKQTADPNPAGDEHKALNQAAANLVNLRTALEAKRLEVAERADNAMRDAENELVVRVPHSEFNAWLEPVT